VLVLRGEFGLAKKPRSTFDNSPALPESLPDFNGCPSVNHDCHAYDKQSCFKSWIYSWGENKWVDLKYNGYTYNPEEPVLEEPVFKMIPLK